MTIHGALERAALLHPSQVAIDDGRSSCSYAELHRRVGSIARFLRRLGLAPGDRISILDVNSQAYVESYFAASAAGLILNPLNYRLTAAELSFILRDAGSRLLVANPEFEQLVSAVVAEGTPLEWILWTSEPPDLASPVPSLAFAEALAEPYGDIVEHHRGDDAVAHLYYTSGTTGQPKGVILTERNVMTHALGTIAELGLSERDVWGHIAPMFHLADAWATFAITLAGGRHWMVPRFDPRTALEAIEKGRITITNLIPTMLNLMIHHIEAESIDYSSLRMILSGGAPIAPELIRRIVDRFGCEYVQTYGMTETSPYLTLSLLKDNLRELPIDEQMTYRARTGRPFITVELRVVGEDGLEVAADGLEVGEIHARGATVTPGYWNRPEETADAFVDGWLRTGDLATIDSEGYLMIVDRRKDMIITGGENVYSTEVEHLLATHPALLEVAVFGLPDPLYGEMVCAAVVMKAQVGIDELDRFCREHLAGFKRPRSFFVLDELPRTGSGKITKRVLRERFGA
jgi:acyl-CoA synthetase (AMP-forming)/AMP-acid ligase II